jgi:hypothetical protein
MIGSFRTPTGGAPYNQIYGISYDTTIAAPEVTRTGNMSLHASLPINSLMKRCILNDAGQVVYYLHNDNSTLKADGTAADITGATGQVMVEIPSYYRKFSSVGNINFADFSLYPFDGAHYVPQKYISAYKATVNRTNNKLSSVVNLSVDYRGGNNNATLDANPNTQLGKPASLISRTNFNTYAQNRGSNWRDMRYHVRKDVYWLITLEYATRNHQTAVNNTLTAQGYRQGALGAGPTNIVGDEWSTFSAYYPIYNCGLTNSLGNKTGEVAVVLNDFPTAGLTRATQVNSYRGVENFFGDIWEWTNGANIKVNNNLAEVFVADGHTVSDANYVSYHKVGEMPYVNGYIKAVIFGAEGDILPLNTTGGSSTTYFSDYYYQSNPASEVLRGLLFGGNAAHGAIAGSACAYSNNAPSITSATIGSRLTFFP